MPRKPPPPGDVRYAYGDLIRRHRVASGYSQTEFANVIGVGITTAQYYERGWIEPTFLTLLRIARACDRPLSAFFAPLDSLEVPPVPEDQPLRTRKYKPRRKKQHVDRRRDPSAA